MALLPLVSTSTDPRGGEVDIPSTPSWEDPFGGTAACLVVISFVPTVAGNIVAAALTASALLLLLLRSLGKLGVVGCVEDGGGIGLPAVRTAASASLGVTEVWRMFGMRMQYRRADIRYRCSSIVSPPNNQG